MEGSIIILELGSLLTLADWLSSQICSDKSVLVHLQAKHSHGKSLTVNKEKFHPQIKQSSNNRTEGRLTGNLKLINGEEMCWAHPMCWSCRFHTRRAWGGCGRRAPLPRGSWRGGRAQSPAGARGKPGSAPRPTTWRWSETRGCWEAAAPGSKPKGCLERGSAETVGFTSAVIKAHVTVKDQHTNKPGTLLEGECLCCTQCHVLFVQLFCNVPCTLKCFG